MVFFLCYFLRFFCVCFLFLKVYITLIWKVLKNVLILLLYYIYCTFPSSAVFSLRAHFQGTCTWFWFCVPLLCCSGLCQTSCSSSAGKSSKWRCRLQPFFSHVSLHVSRAKSHSTYVDNSFRQINDSHFVSVRLKNCREGVDISIFG